MSAVMTKTEWVRVSKNNLCPICKKDDWCVTSEDQSVTLCMRVESNNPSKGKAGGWIHKAREDFKPAYLPPIRKAAPRVEIDSRALWESWSRDTESEPLISFAEKLGVDPLALNFLGCVWSTPNLAWAFPMHDGKGKVIGIRLRNASGEKWAVKGSHSGIFVAPRLSVQKTVYIVEGPTDCAAALTLGLCSIGRPSCQGCHDHVNEFIRFKKIQNAVIIADSDRKRRPDGSPWNPGLEGAQALQRYLKVTSCILIPPAKDLREFLNLGGNLATVEAMTKNLIWKKP